MQSSRSALRCRRRTELSKSSQGDRATTPATRMSCSAAASATANDRVPTCRVARQHQLGGVVTTVDQPVHGFDAVADAGGDVALRALSVGDRQHGQPGALGQPFGDPPVSGQSAHDERAAVEVDDGRLAGDRVLGADQLSRPVAAAHLLDLGRGQARDRAHAELDQIDEGGGRTDGRKECEYRSHEGPGADPHQLGSVAAARDGPRSPVASCEERTRDCNRQCAPRHVPQTLNETAIRPDRVGDSWRCGGSSRYAAEPVLPMARAPWEPEVELHTVMDLSLPALRPR